MAATMKLPYPPSIPTRASPSIGLCKALSPSLSLCNPKPYFPLNQPFPNRKRLFVVVGNYSPRIITTAEPKPVSTSVRCFAPATIANLGPGFDFLGCAVDGHGDYVTVRVDPKVYPGQISISEISGPHATPELFKDPFLNPAGIAAITTMKKLEIRSVGLSLQIEKHLPPGSGLGSSAASAAAAALAVNELFGNKLTLEQLVHAGLQSESMFSGYHADNIAPAVMGGIVLISRDEPLELRRLKFPTDKKLLFVLATPNFKVAAKKMREVLPVEIGMAHCVWNCSQSAALVAALLEGDVEGVGKAMSADKIIEPRRASLIPGMAGVKNAAIEAGAFGCTISGSGPTMVAVVDDEEIGQEVGNRMVEAFMKEGNLRAVAVVTRLDRVGARRVGSVPRWGW